MFNSGLNRLCQPDSDSDSVSLTVGLQKRGPTALKPGVRSSSLPVVLRTQCWLKVMPHLENAALCPVAVCAVLLGVWGKCANLATSTSLYLKALANLESAATYTNANQVRGQSSSERTTSVHVSLFTATGMGKLYDYELKTHSVLSSLVFWLPREAAG